MMRAKKRDSEEEEERRGICFCKCTHVGKFPPGGPFVAVLLCTNPRSTVEKYPPKTPSPEMYEGRILVFFVKDLISKATNHGGNQASDAGNQAKRQEESKQEQDPTKLKKNPTIKQKHNCSRPPRKKEKEIKTGARLPQCSQSRNDMSPHTGVEKKKYGPEQNPEE